MFRTVVARIDWRRDAVLWGRLLATAVTVLGIIAVAIDAWDLSEFGDSVRARYFITLSLSVVWAGSLILIVTELVARLRHDKPLPFWNVADLVRVLGGAVIVIGLLVASWSAVDDRDAMELSRAESIRHALQTMLNGYLWQGGLLILLAAVADHIGWRNDEELPDEGEAPVVVTEP